MARYDSRREFLARAAAITIGALPLRRSLFSNRSALSVRLAIVGGNDARVDGAQLGIEEARHAATLFGGDIALATLAPDGALPHGVTAVIGDADLARTRRLIRDAASAGALFMNVACTDDALRGSDCAASAFHIAPSDAMRRDGGGRDAVVAWDESLTKFGADTLNQRFRARFGRAMTGDAWCAWLAVKVTWESALRTKSGDARRIGEYLTRETTQFDGHKGRPLSFRSWDHQLRQPLYVKRGSVIDEVPTAPSPDASSREVLDQLGVGAAQSSCRMGQ